MQLTVAFDVCVPWQLYAMCYPGRGEYLTTSIEFEMVI